MDVEGDEEEEGALGTGREFQSARGLFGGAGGSLSRGASPGVQGKGRLCKRTSAAAPAECGRSGGGGGGRSLSAGGRGRGLSLWWDAALLVIPGLEAPEEFDGLGGSKSSLGGTGGREDCGATDIGDGGRSTLLQASLLIIRWGSSSLSSSSSS